MNEIFLERTFDEPLDIGAVIGLAEAANDCMTIYRVIWRGSLLSSDGHRMVCRFSAPDAESARRALKESGADASRLWPGTVHEGHGGVGANANVVVERAFDEPASIESLQAQEDAKRWCLDVHHVTFVRTFFSSDRKRMICLYQAPDAESVRAAQRQAGLPFDRVWPCRTIDRDGDD